MKRTVTFVFSIAASVILLLSTQKYNLGVTPDSVKYLEIAKNISNGNGIVGSEGLIVNHFPPIYPLLLAVTATITDLSVFDTGRYLNAFLIASLFFVFNRIQDLFKCGIWQRIFLNMFLLLSVPLQVFAFFWSEGAFLVILLVIFFFLLRWRQEQKISVLILAGIFSGLLFLTRYAALGFIGGWILCLLLYQSKEIRQRLRNTTYYCSSMLLILSIWYIYKFFHESEGGRQIVFHPIPFRKFLSFFKTAVSWIAPFENEIYMIAFSFVVLSITILAFLRTKMSKQRILHLFKRNKDIFLLILLPITSYIVFLIIAISFLDAQIPMDNRLLGAIFLLFFILSIPFTKNLFKKFDPVFIPIIFSLLFISLGYGSTKYWYKHNQTGQGYTSKLWKTSNLLRSVSKYGQTKVYTNSSNALALYYPLQKNKISNLPAKLYAGTMLEESSYSSEIRAMEDSVKKGESVIVYFFAEEKFYLPNKEEILILFSEEAVQFYEDGFLISLEK